MKPNRAAVISALVLAIVGSSVVPSAYRPAIFHHFDAADHVIGYSALSAAVAYIVRSQHALILIAGLACLAASLELIQAVIPSRDASYQDFYGSILGILLGITLGRLPIWVADRRVSIRGR